MHSTIPRRQAIIKAVRPSRPVFSRQAFALISGSRALHVSIGASDHERCRPVVRSGIDIHAFRNHCVGALNVAAPTHRHESRPPAFFRCVDSGACGDQRESALMVEVMAGKMKRGDSIVGGHARVRMRSNQQAEAFLVSKLASNHRRSALAIAYGVDGCPTLDQRVDTQLIVPSAGVHEICPPIPSYPDFVHVHSRLNERDNTLVAAIAHAMFIALTPVICGVDVCFGTYQRIRAQLVVLLANMHEVGPPMRIVSDRVHVRSRLNQHLDDGLMAIHTGIRQSCVAAHHSRVDVHTSIDKHASVLLQTLTTCFQQAFGCYGDGFVEATPRIRQISNRKLTLFFERVHLLLFATLPHCQRVRVLAACVLCVCVCVCVLCCVCCVLCVLCAKTPHKSTLKTSNLNTPKSPDPTSKSPVGVAKSGVGAGRRRRDFFSEKIFFRKNFFPVSSVMHLDEKLGPSRPAGQSARFSGRPVHIFLRAFSAPKNVSHPTILRHDLGILRWFEVVPEVRFFNDGHTKSPVGTAKSGVGIGRQSRSMFSPAQTHTHDASSLERVTVIFTVANGLVTRTFANSSVSTMRSTVATTQWMSARRWNGLQSSYRFLRCGSMYVFRNATRSLFMSIGVVGSGLRSVFVLV